MFGIDDIILGAAVTGAATSLFGAMGKNKAQKQLRSDELEAEQVRRTQMEYDASRQQRQLIRNSQVARSIGISNEVNSGSQFGSAMGGMTGQQQGQSGVQSNNVYQNLQLGEKSFDINRKIAYDKSDVSKQQDIVGLGQTISGLGQPLSRLSGGIQNGSPQGASSGGPDPWAATVMFGD